MPDDELKIGESVNKAREQATVTANDLIESLRGSIGCGYMTYPELIRILRYFLLKTMNEMIIYRFGLPALSLKELGLKKLHNALEDLEKREQKKK